MITQRQNDILSVIVDLFIQTQEPVGSKALQEVIASSSATIRNDMARLEKLGLLEKAHTSSGRLPSRAGFQYFVSNCLTYEQTVEEDIYKVVKAFDFEAFKLDDLLLTASQLLADMTGYTAVVLDVEPRRQHLTGFEVVPISTHDALAVLTLDGSKPVTVQFAIPRNFLAKDLASLKALVQERLLNQTLLEVHYKLRTEIPQVIHRYFAVTDKVLDLLDYLFAPVFEDDPHIAGKVAALTYADLETYRFLDNSRAVALAIRDSMTEEETSKIVVGNHPDSQLANLTVISQKVLVPYRGFASLTLIGPINLPYKRVLGLMDVIGKVLTMKLSDYYRYLSSNHYEVN